MDGALQDQSREIEALREKLRIAESKAALLRQLIDLLPDYFYVHDYGLRFQITNDAGAQLWGLTPQDMIGKTYAEVDPHPEQARTIVDVCQRIMRHGKPARIDNFPFTDIHGRPRVFSQFNVPFQHPRTGEPMLLGIARDMTAESELMSERVRRQDLERDLHIAKQIQQSIRPTLTPHMRGWEIAAEAIPSAYAAGDFYDWFQPAGSELTLLCIGDATGHGVGPALHAASCRAYARALLKGRGELEQEIVRLNHAVFADMNGGRFVTFAAVELCPCDSYARVVSAGHGPILVCRHNGDVEVLDSHGLPLGIEESFELTPGTMVRMEPGDALLLLSDGLTEAHHDQRGFLGLDAIIKTTRDMCGASSYEVAQRLVKLAADHSDTEAPADDLTAVVVRHAA